MAINSKENGLMIGSMVMAHTLKLMVISIWDSGKMIYRKERERNNGETTPHMKGNIIWGRRRAGESIHEAMGPGMRVNGKIISSMGE